MDSARCDNNGVRAQILTTPDPHSPLAHNHGNYGRDCAKDFDKWFMLNDPGQCPIERHLPFKYDSASNLWLYDSGAQGIPAPWKNNPNYKGFFVMDGLGWDDRLPCAGEKVKTGTSPDDCSPWKHFQPWDKDGTKSANYSMDHNFLFTTRFDHKFKYIASEMDQSAIKFSGDDDVWGFIRSYGDDPDPAYIEAQLFLDIGGVHAQLSDAAWLGPARNGDRGLNLKDGKSYEVVVFVAERQCCQSNVKLFAPITTCLCAPDDGTAPFGVDDDRFPPKCNPRLGGVDPHHDQCDGHTFDYVAETHMVKADAFANGISTGQENHKFCKTCQSECANTARGQQCAVCEECFMHPGGKLVCGIFSLDDLN
jgi:fibro-slime domain-containing protein